MRGGYRKRFFTAASFVNLLKEQQKQYELNRFLNQLGRSALLICNELGYHSFTPNTPRLRSTRPLKSTLRAEASGTTALRVTVEN